MAGTMKSRQGLPREVYALVERAPATVLLESAGAGGSRLFTDPLRVVAAWNAEELDALFAEIESAQAQGYCAAGFFTYECGGIFEPKAAMAAGEVAQPLAWFGIYARSYCFDAAGGFAGDEPPELAEARARAVDEGEPLVELTPTITQREYDNRIAAIHEWIRAGDVYQLNYTFSLRGRLVGSAAALYRRLRSRQPVEYGAFVHWETGRKLLSFSPELFFRVEEQGGTRRITTRPMKGTAARGRTTAEDQRIAQALRDDAKNRAENVMIVDLLRSDLGRLCRFGSVRVDDLFAVERYATLWQMTSTVSGELRPGVGAKEILRALFPCGSVTGAPKVRAMQLLAQLEGEPRGVYTGAIGYFSQERTVFNVAIRTLEVNGNDCRMGVGSGIVIDSTAGDEFGECTLKAEFLSRAEEPFQLVETLLWRSGYPLLELHLDRLEDSADYFGFACDRAAAKAALLEEAAGFSDETARKVRLLADANGTLEIESEMLLEETDAARACISPGRTNSQDRLLYHKTTHRENYAKAWEAARAAGFCDVLFLNERGEVTEGAISNVFIEKDGRWLTPPLECGLLAGVYRRHLLETQTEIEERVLTLHDLKTADAVYLTNALRGLRRVTLEWPATEN